MVSGLFSTARELPRLREISMVLVRHGLGDLVRRAGIATLLEHAGHALQWGEATEIAHLETQQRARLAFEQLGPTFVHICHMLSTREDLLPPAWTTELARLHSDVAPVPFDDLLPQVEQALGRSPLEVFGDVEHEPYAAASIAQIHRAKLASGTPVVLKIRRPGVEAKIDADLRILDHLAHVIERVRPFLDSAMRERYQSAEVVRRAQVTLRDFFGLVTSMPRDLARLVKEARHGRLRIDLDLKRLDSFGHLLHGAVNRATIGIMTASLVIGSSIVMTVAEGPRLFGVSLLTYCGLLGYLVAFVNSLWIIFSIWRSSRR